VQKKNKNLLIIILVAILTVYLFIRIISPWTVTNLDHEGIKAVIYNHYDEEFPSWPKSESHNITIERILATEVINYGSNGKMLLVFHHNKQNGYDTIKYTHITRPMLKWIVGSSWIAPLELMLEREPISVSVSDIPNASLVYGFINDPRAERVVVGSENTSFEEATIINVELTDGRTVRLYYLVPLVDIEIIVLDSDNNVIYETVAAYDGF
jgi:hypothetical protein